MATMKSLKTLFAFIVFAGLALASHGGSTNQLEMPFNRLRGQKFVVDSSDIRVVTWSYKVMPEDSLATIEVFTRDGQTNLVRQTRTKNGVVLFRSQSFYYNGIEVGGYIYQTANGPDRTMIGSTPGGPYFFNIAFDASNKPIVAHIMATNFVEVDLFTCTNGVFYPAESSLIREANARLPKGILRH